MAGPAHGAPDDQKTRRALARTAAEDALSEAKITLDERAQSGDGGVNIQT